MKDSLFDSALLGLMINGNLGLEISKVSKIDRFRFIKNKLTELSKVDPLLKFTKDKDIDDYIGRLKNKI